MSGKSEHLQIRVTPAQKQALTKLAKRSGQSLSAFVLSRVLPPVAARVQSLVEAMVDDSRRRFALAEFNDLISSLAGSEFLEALADVDVSGLPRCDQNYVAAMVELAAQQKGVAPPAWPRRIEPLEEPHFAAPFPSLRLHLLRASPVAFRRRNIFVDSAVGDRV